MLESVINHLHLHLHIYIYIYIIGLLFNIQRDANKLRGILQFSPDLQLYVYLTNYPDILTSYSQLIFLHAPQKRVLQAAIFEN